MARAGSWTCSCPARSQSRCQSIAGRSSTAGFCDSSTPARLPRRGTLQFARMHVTPEQELPAAMAGAGLELNDVSEVVLTHAHGDHMDGLVHVRGRILINDAELRFLGSPMARVMRRVLRQPLRRNGSLPSRSRSTAAHSACCLTAGRSAMTDGSSPSRRPGTPPVTSR